MKSLIVEMFRMVAPVSVAVIVFAQGLRIAPSQVGTYVTEQPGLMLRSLTAKMDGWSYVVIAAVSAAAVAIGHLTGPRDPHEKTLTAVECGVRHPVLAIAIGAANCTPQRALPVLVPCVLTFMAVAMVYLFWRGRSR